MNKQELTAALNSIEPEDFKELLHYLCAYRINSISVISHYGVPFSAPPNEEKGYWTEAREQFVNKYVELIEENRQEMEDATIEANVRYAEQYIKSAKKLN